MAHIITNVV